MGSPPSAMVACCSVVRAGSLALAGGSLAPGLPRRFTKGLGALPGGYYTRSWDLPMLARRRGGTASLALELH